MNTCRNTSITVTCDQVTNPAAVINSCIYASIRSIQQISFTELMYIVVFLTIYGAVASKFIIGKWELEPETGS